MSPTVSVGICAHDEEETIGTLLDQVMAEDIPLEEVLVVVAGDDDTATIVEEKADRHDTIRLLQEEERRGQTAAQNWILAEATGEVLLLVDGDGLITDGSLEALVDRYTGENILYGREIPDTDGSLLGRMTDLLWELHHDLCLEQPKFSTQIGLIPGTLLDRIPEDIVLDDEYIGVMARDKGYDIEYVPDAVKHHHTDTTLRFIFHQRRKNWSGRLQIQHRGHGNLQSTGHRAAFFLDQFLSRPFTEKALLLGMAGIEAGAIMVAYVDRLRRDWPTIWYR